MATKITEKKPGTALWRQSTELARRQEEMRNRQAKKSDRLRKREDERARAYLERVEREADLQRRRHSPRPIWADRKELAYQQKEMRKRQTKEQARARREQSQPGRHAWRRILNQKIIDYAVQAFEAAQRGTRAVDLMLDREPREILGKYPAILRLRNPLNFIGFLVRDCHQSVEDDTLARASAERSEDYG